MQSFSNLHVSALEAGGVAGFAAVKVVLTSLALNDFAGSGDFYALGEGFIGFHTKNDLSQ